MKSKDPYSGFDASKLVGKTLSGKPYLRPSSAFNTGIGLDNAMKGLRRPGVAAGANLTRSNAQEIEQLIQDRLAKKSTTKFNRLDRLELNHELEQKYRQGKLSRNDIKDAQAIIDKLSE